jgi:putative restriction endonuclease
MNREQLLARFANLRTWQSEGEHAPHKPLLILLALGEWQNGRQAIRFKEIEKVFSELLRDYGASREALHPEYPFWRLQNDVNEKNQKVWEVVTSSQIQLGADRGASKGELLRVDARGQFTEDIRFAFTADCSLVPALGRFILQAHFPESEHQGILEAVGLDPG